MYIFLPVHVFVVVVVVIATLQDTASLSMLSLAEFLCDRVLVIATTRTARTSRTNTDELNKLLSLPTTHQINLPPLSKDDTIECKLVTCFVISRSVIFFTDSNSDFCCPSPSLVARMFLQTKSINVDLQDFLWAKTLGSPFIVEEISHALMNCDAVSLTPQLVSLKPNKTLELLDGEVKYSFPILRVACYLCMKFWLGFSYSSSLTQLKEWSKVVSTECRLICSFYSRFLLINDLRTSFLFILFILFYFIIKGTIF
jgi:hypothetical protein